MRNASRALSPTLLTLLLAAGCGGVGGVLGGDPDDAGRTATDVVGEVERVDLLDDEVLVRDRGGRVWRLRYEADTPVLFEGRQYRVENLEPGDTVRVEVREESGGTLVARRITVEQSVQERGAGTTRPPAVDEVVGEVVRVDRAELVVDDGRGGTQRIGYSADTEVYYRGERYEVANLEPGDLVRVEVRRDRSGDRFTDYVVVTRSRQEGGGATPTAPRPGEGAVETFSGRVTWVEQSRGRFGVDAEYRGPLTVLMPYDPAAPDRDAFERLRTGDRVTLRAEWLGDGRVQLVRFED
jgi:ribosomal protein L19